ncbi:cytochrome P450 [Streptomyces sp. NBC_00487]|uniref:cytochrome P450 n=1 Tax=unclassified Streptomyces TaxID=2593676 RepID=UPI002E17A4FD|nr:MULTISPECIES: cytochrome P450 [unclassified Streptomyces]
MNEIAVDAAPEFPILRTCPFSVPETYRKLDEAGGRVHQVRMSDGRRAWLITKNEDARAVLSDARFSSEKLRPGFPELSPGGLKALTYFSPFLVNMDGPEHSQARRAVLGEFSVRKINAMKPRIQRIVDTAIDRMLEQPDRPVDLVAHLAGPVPTLVLEAFLGVPADDLDAIERNTGKMLREARTEDDQRAAAEALHAHLDRVIAAKEESPADDFLSRQIDRSRREHGGVADRFELASLVQLLQIAGHASSAAMISLSVLTLLANPEQLNELTTDPARTPAVVEELLRFLSITDTGPLRLALEDVEIGGVRIRAGDGVMIPTLPANRDADAFPDPDRFDIGRASGTRHVAFGYGAHQCLGQNIVRTELQVILDRLFHRVPELRLAAEPDALPYKYFGQFFGPVELPVTW